jgi:FkbM family methyltransferase
MNSTTTTQSAFSFFASQLIACTPVKYLQIGGNDGVYADPLYPLLISHRDRFTAGAVYEPHPFWHSRLLENMASFPFVSCYQCAVLGDDDDRSGASLFYIDSSDIQAFDLPEWAQGVSSLHSDRNALGSHGCSPQEYEALKSHIRSVTVPCKTFAACLRDIGFIPDLLIIDVEGHDFEIIKGWDPGTSLYPYLVQIEFTNLPPHDQVAAVALLEKARYILWREGSDLLATHYSMLKLISQPSLQMACQLFNRLRSSDSCTSALASNLGL